MPSQTNSASARLTRGDAARARLLDVAERLFAERGIDAVSLNSIAREANQLNASVMQYHFTSKTGVIEAILTRRMESINARRSQLIANIDPRNRAAALRRSRAFHRWDVLRVVGRFVASRCVLRVLATMPRIAARISPLSDGHAAATRSNSASSSRGLLPDLLPPRVEIR